MNITSDFGRHQAKLGVVEREVPVLRKLLAGGVFATTIGFGRQRYRLGTSPGPPYVLAEFPNRSGGCQECDIADAAASARLRLKPRQYRYAPSPFAQHVNAVTLAA